MSLFGGKSLTSCVGILQSKFPSHVAGQSHQHRSASYRKVPPFWQTIATPSAAHGGGPSTEGRVLSHGLPITGENNHHDVVSYSNAVYRYSWSYACVFASTGALKHSIPKILSRLFSTAKLLWSSPPR